MKKLVCLLLCIVLLSLICSATDYDGYVVKLSDNMAHKLSQNLSVYSDAYLLEELDDSGVVKLVADELENVTEISSDHLLVMAEDETALDELISLGIVDGYEKNIYYELLGYEVSSNPYYQNQKWYLDYINASFAWNAGIFGNDVIVAVIDSGVNPHSDIKKNLLQGKNFIDVESLGETYTLDNSDHGTRVAGIIAAECNNLASVGISFKTKILPLKVTEGSKLSLVDAISAIYYAVEQGCDVINLSFGSEDGDSQALKNAINAAISNNIIVVAAAGNSALEGNPLIYPACYSNVISVSNAKKNASGTSLVVSDSSQRNSFVDIAAPGTGIYTLTNTDGVSDSKSGTSFACPVISSVAALAKSVNPYISQSQFEELLKASADSSYLSSSGQDATAWGAGLVDIESFLKHLLSDKKCYVSENVTVSGESFVYLTNLSDVEAIQDCTVIISERDSANNLNVEYLKCSLSPGESLEISLSDNGFSSAANVRVIYDRVPGDVNGDEVVSVRDASVILRYLAGYDVAADVSMMDVNGDGVISVRDAAAILRFCAGYNVELH